MINVVLADDSAFLRQVLKDTLETVSNGEVKVIGQAKNGKEAIDLVKEKRPDVLILDCEMPVMNGLEALRVIMKECPVPVFMFSSLTAEGAAVTIKALEYGAVDFLLKPAGGAHALDTVADELIKKLKFVVLKGRFSTLRRSMTTHAQTAQAQSGGAPQTKIVSLNDLRMLHIDLIAMGSSTGGVQAATAVISKLPASTPPIVWVQHMPPNFTKSFAERLNQQSAMEVKEAQNGDIVEKGVCLLAPGGYQMRLKKFGTGYKVEIGGTEKVSGHCPSCNVLFDSVSEYFGRNALGVILTGMGDDGTQGLVKMHSKGSFVIGQNERSCVVYGMPRAAMEAGAVDAEFDITEIPLAIKKICGIH